MSNGYTALLGTIREPFPLGGGVCTVATVGISVSTSRVGVFRTRPVIYLGLSLLQNRRICFLEDPGDAKYMAPRSRLPALHVQHEL